MGIPFVMPTLVVGAAFTALLGSRGWINLGLMELFNLAEPPLKFTNTLGAILVAHMFYNTTIILRMVGDFWSHLDPRLEQAARRVRCQPLAGDATDYISPASARDYRCYFAGIYLRLYLLWSDPCPGRATIYYPGSRDPLPNGKPI